MTIDDQERQASIARLVAGGKMTQEKAGQYVADHVSDKARGNIPDYDPAVVRTELPHVLEIFFDEDDTGCFAMVEDGMLGEVVRVPLGDDPPPTTDDLVRVIQNHYAGALDTKALDKTRGLFDSFGDEDEGTD